MIPTGGINVKGKGMMDTYLWECPRGSDAAGPDALASARRTRCNSNVGVDTPSTRMRTLLLQHQQGGRLSVAPLMRAYNTVAGVQWPQHTNSKL